MLRSVICFIRNSNLSVQSDKIIQLRPVLMTFSIFLLISFFTAVSIAQPLDFPGAHGSGKFTTGGREGNVIYVTDLIDNGPGSLRAAINDRNPRTIVFAVSGTIFLKSEIEIGHGNLTIARILSLLSSGFHQMVLRTLKVLRFHIQN
jgi:hypothetical protein